MLDSPVLPTLSAEDRRVCALHAELHAHRVTLLRSILAEPDDVAAREPLWVELYRLLGDTERTKDRIRDALPA